MTKAWVFDAYGTILDIGTIDGLLVGLFGERGAEVGQRWRHRQLEYTWLR